MLFLDSITEYPKFTLVLYVLGEMKKMVIIKTKIKPLS